jgi:hypothetical protein
MIEEPFDNKHGDLKALAKTVNDAYIRERREAREALAA